MHKRLSHKTPVVQRFCTKLLRSLINETINEDNLTYENNLNVLAMLIIAKEVQAANKDVPRFISLMLNEMVRGPAPAEDIKLAVIKNRIETKVRRNG